jgi:PAS domain S-box-containing protein
VPSESLAGEIKDLRRCINDLVSVLALPALWTGSEPTQIVHTLLDTLRGMLCLDLVYVRLKDLLPKTPEDMLGVAQSAKLTLRPQEICELLNDQVGADPERWPSLLGNLDRDGYISILALQLGLHGELGVIVAGSHREDFPQQTERLVLSVAANQASISLQEAQLLSKQKQLAIELDQRVAQRTIDLAEANEELRNEIAERKLVEERLCQDEMELRRSEVRKAAILDSALDCIVTVDHQGCVTEFNPDAEQTFGYRRDEVLGKQLSDVIIPLALREEHRRSFARYLATGEERVLGRRVEMTAVRANGSEFPVELAITRIPLDGPPSFTGCLRDITERKQAEEALRASELNLRQMTETIPEMLWSANPEGAIDYCNARFLDYTGFSAEEVMRHGWQRTIHPDDAARVGPEWTSCVRSGALYRVEVRTFHAADRGYRWCLVSALPLLNANGRILRWHGTIVDMHDQKLAEENLRRSEADLLEAQRLTHTGNWKQHVASGTITVSPEVHRIFGSGPDDDASKADFWFSRMHPEDRKRTQELFEKSKIEKTDYKTDYRIVLPDGVIRYQHAVGHPMLNESGELVEFVGTIMDVTEQVQARIALENAFEEIKRLKDRLHEQNVALREEIDKASMFEEIVGNSTVLHAVLSRLAKVAPTNSSVLITGETGAGKELFARAIHRRSRRSARAFISVNCAAIPPGLIASELFGHEKGAFTGATQRRLGRFELADGGTIFLDEVGELPVETQIALLRVLQEHEFERVGGTQSIRTDVRVIAATNRDLEAAISNGTFRSDLFYRLSVFPIEVPALRERREDIPLLVEYFIDRFARKAGKNITGINKKGLGLLQAYSWPGNIRELQNVIERSVIVALVIFSPLTNPGFRKDRHHVHLKFKHPRLLNARSNLKSERSSRPRWP